MSLRLVRRLLLTVLGVVLAVLVMELGLRSHGSFNVTAAGRELALFGGDQARVRELYELDPELGFRPHLPSSLYAEHGALRNDYGPTPAPGRERILVVGDSVVFRGQLVAALRERFGEERYEFWNGGVTAYNTAQEVGYLRRYTLGTHPQRIVLVFHPNDFVSTPISFRDRSGRLNVVTPSASRARVVPWLYRYSHVYRWWLGRSISADEEEAAESVRASLIELRDLCRDGRIPLDVLVLPHLTPRSEWTPVIERRRAWILDTLAELGIRHFDLLEPMLEALESGFDVQETRGDHDHPSDEACRAFCAYLERAGFGRPRHPD